MFAAQGKREVYRSAFLPIDIFQVVLEVKNLPASAGDERDIGLIPGLGRSPGVGNGYSLQYSCLENPMDRGAWQATPWGCKQSDTAEA